MSDHATLQLGAVLDRSNRDRDIQDHATPSDFLLTDIAPVMGFWRRDPEHEDAAAPVNLRIRSFLGSRTFLGSLPAKAFETLLSRAHIKSYASGDVVCRRQLCSQTMLIVISGSLKIATSNVDGREIVFDFAGPGHISGEVCMLDGLERTADAVALDDCEVCLLHARDLLPVLKANPLALLELTRGLCLKLRAASARIEDNALDVRRRVARGLVRLAGKHGRSARHGLYVGLEVSQTELSSYLGMSRENVNRELRSLRSAGVIGRDRNLIVILDEPLLREAAEASSTGRARKPTCSRRRAFFVTTRSQQERVAD